MSARVSILKRLVLRRVCAALTAASAWAPHALAQDAASLQAAREWNQPRGDADLSASCDVEPIVRPPQEAWRLPFKELYADPVCWGGMVFVAGMQKLEPMLYAFDLKTGKSAVTSTRLPGAKPGSLAVWQGFVAFVQPDGVQILSLRGGQFTTARKQVPVALGGPPSVLAGQLFVCDWKDVVHCIDLDQGKELGHFDGGQGQPAVVGMDGEHNALVASVTYGRPKSDDPDLMYVGQYLGLELCDVRGLGTASPAFSRRQPRYHAPFKREIEDQALAGSIPIALGRDEDNREPGWMIYCTELLQSAKSKSMHVARFPKALYDLRSPPVICNGYAIGFTPGGDLVVANPDGSYGQVSAEQKSPVAKRRTLGLTRARGVLYLENWALRFEDGRVLWELPELDLARGLWPVADGLALYVSAKKELVCLRDPGIGAPAAPGLARKSPRPSALGSGAAVVLRDGTRLPGALRRAADGSVELTPEAGAPRTIAAAELALLETPEGVVRAGPELGAYRAAFATCSFDYREALGAQLENYLQLGLVDEARAQANQLKAFGAEAAELAALDKRLSGRTARDDRSAGRMREAGQKEEARLRQKAAKQFLDSARWCRDHALALAASVLYADALRVDAGTAGVPAEVLPLVPAGAPWHGDGDAALRWMELARELLPSDAGVVPPDDPLWKRLEGSSWTAQSIALRSPNLELVSRELDAHILGRALQLGERTVEVLQHMLGEVTGSPARLDVRLHASRDDYQAELKATTGATIEWMGGHYSPRENVSRFFVARAGSEADRAELDRVLTHELVHHYVESRWLAAAREELLARQKQPGFWIVEGLAEFVSGQVREMERRGERVDDAEVLAVDATAQLEGERLLIPIARLVELDHESFWKLGDKPLAGVRLRHSLASLEVTERTIFYQQSAALVFYLLNESGKRHAPLVPEYLRSWYHNVLGPGTWKALDYETSEELAAGFVQFLEARRKR